jgi:N-acetylglutamate synthase-like GNAT family acetyltransferase
MAANEPPAGEKPVVHIKPIRPEQIDWLSGMDWAPLVKERDTFYLLALAMQGRWAFLAEIDGEPAGLVLASTNDAQSQLYVNHLLVGAAYRGAGVGTALMDRLEQETRAAGIRRVWLMTVEARGFYERRGYRVADDVLPGPLQRFVERVKRSQVMVKDLFGNRRSHSGS